MFENARTTNTEQLLVQAYICLVSKKLTIKFATNQKSHS